MAKAPCRLKDKAEYSLIYLSDVCNHLVAVTKLVVVSADNFFKGFYLFLQLLNFLFVASSHVSDCLLDWGHSESETIYIQVF